MKFISSCFNLVSKIELGNCQDYSLFLKENRILSICLVTMATSQNTVNFRLADNGHLVITRTEVAV